MSTHTKNEIGQMLLCKTEFKIVHFCLLQHKQGYSFLVKIKYGKWDTVLKRRYHELEQSLLNTENAS